MKKETSKKLSLRKIKIANLSQVNKALHIAIPTTTVLSANLSACDLCPANV